MKKMLVPLRIDILTKFNAKIQLVKNFFTKYGRCFFIFDGHIKKQVLDDESFLPFFSVLQKHVSLVIYGSHFRAHIPILT